MGIEVQIKLREIQIISFCPLTHPLHPARMDEGTSDRVPAQPRKRKPSTKVLENGDIPVKRPRKANVKDKAPPNEERMPSPVSHPIPAISIRSTPSAGLHELSDSEGNVARGTDTEADDDVIVVEDDVPEEPGEDAEAELS